MRWLIAHVLPRMPLATSADAAADSFLFMALDPSLDGVGRKFFGEKHESSPVPSHTTLTRPGASGSWRASSLAWMRPERNAFWASVYLLRTTRPEEPRLGSALNALTMYCGDRMTVG
jgi:hypothetical protein